MQGKVWGVQSAETGELVLYPREHPPLIKVSADVAALWHEVAVSNPDRCSMCSRVTIYIAQGVDCAALAGHIALPGEDAQPISHMNNWQCVLVLNIPLRVILCTVQRHPEC